jgi:hypothetical protein
MVERTDDQKRGRSIGQKRRHALEVLKTRREFLERLVTKRKATGQPTDREADEASVLAFVISELTAKWSGDAEQAVT